MRRFVRRAFGVVLALAVVGALGGLARSSQASSGRRVAGSADRGVLQQFAPRSATTWWAVVESNLHAKTWIVRTTDSGRHWHAVTPPVKLVASSSFLGTKLAWVDAESLYDGAPGAPRTEPVYRTLDGGRSWRRLGRVASGCQLDFVDTQHGWCIGLGGAAGSMFVSVDRTTDGGGRWSLVSRTGVNSSTPGALPFGCDKTISFTSPREGWAALYCNGGRAGLYISMDGGARWRELPFPPMPRGAPPARAGGGVSLPAVHGSHLAVSLDVDGTSYVAIVIATSSNRGRTWRSRLAPGDPRYGTVDLIDARHFVLSNGSVLLATSDAGRHWHGLKATKRFVNTLSTPFTPDFVSPLLGFAIPMPDGGPMWWTRDGGATWKPITITAGPFTLR